MSVKTPLLHLTRYGVYDSYVSVKIFLDGLVENERHSYRTRPQNSHKISLEKIDILLAHLRDLPAETSFHCDDEKTTLTNTLDVYVDGDLKSFSWFGYMPADWTTVQKTLDYVDGICEG